MEWDIYEKKKTTYFFIMNFAKILFSFVFWIHSNST